MKRILSKALMSAGALLILGAAGDSDTGALTIEGAVLKVGIGIALFVVGYILYKKAKTSEQSSEDFTKHFISYSKQDATSAYKNNFNTVQVKCQPRYKQNISKSEVIGC